MPKLVQIISLVTAVMVNAYAATPHPPQTSPDKPTSAEPTSVIIVFKDGHQETYSMSDIARIEYKTASDSVLGPDHFLGKWEVGDGNSGTFFITFQANGEATRSLGASHGIWTIVGDEARVSWDDGWHDVIREVGYNQHEKLAFAPDTTFDDKPANVTAAHKVEPKKIEPETK
ncbi:MAG TPA: hypothetical protein VH640_16825 [Bryobacteraceae bacterium]|jgi:hypothetical protein